MNMIYLDYSATTKTDESVLETYVAVCKQYIGNPNSLHKLGLDAKNLIDASTKQVADILKVKQNEIIYTSGASEANNTAIKGVAFKYKNRGQHIITTQLEHSSVLETIKYLESMGYAVSYAPLDDDGKVDILELEKLIRPDTILVSIASINSEIGIRQDIDKIGKMLKKYPKILFHSDMTQSIGKEKVNFENVDLASMSSQKFYGLKGSGVLYKKEKVELEPLIHGGKSTTSYRSGTPAVAEIACFAKALRLAYQDFELKQEKVKELNQYLIKELEKITSIHINSTIASIAHIINISIPGIKPETMLHALEEEEIYISTKTACSSSHNASTAVLSITKSEQLANSSVRISISHLTEKEELITFIKVLKEKISYLSSFKK